MALPVLGLLALAGGTAGGAIALADSSRHSKYSTARNLPDSSPYGLSRMQAAQELLRRHNAGELNLPDQQQKGDFLFIFTLLN